MMNFSLKGFLGAIGPFLPVGVGIALKFSLIDKPTSPLADFFKTTYINGIWIDFIVTAYISGIAWLLTRKPDKPPETSLIFVLLIAPLVAFVICVSLAFGSPKAGFGEFFSLYMPALIAGLSVALAGNALATT
jgi:hypothetical protein